ncbi:uncharacterized protein LDX57_007802 [Aspergillus melleus]|uniref:uncharacterized protein n=1 Tax=Aspergillus melleus TaxID=138277 RepID=UPI001E8D70F6|nr:uncharacterized protein LDX57_007802 [Aspergillus melleus]KAH8430132.1 hypothetical protein LDX57_007802 [Aspergillus melleus]
MTSTGSSESDGESAETWLYSASSTAVSSEDSEDRDFVVSDSEPLSFHDSRASSPDRNVPRSACDNDDADPKPVYPHQL